MVRVCLGVVWCGVVCACAVGGTQHGSLQSYLKTHGKNLNLNIKVQMGYDIAKGPAPCPPMVTICLPHFRSYEAASLYMCVLPYKYPYAQGCDLS